ncbi:MAG: 2,3-bisphosphoglycerate-dependent phosphoglycerate mutase [Sideroxyarcus sp.]|nr:2,3-bisphosphoglycerate-dependent phosphoglycerate mutase [Sideroxyarcus sp.]
MRLGQGGQIVLLRHGESVWNKENLFTGWTDVDLSEHGKTPAIEAGRVLQEHGFIFDMAFTSVLKRAIWTLWLVLDQNDPRHPRHDARYSALSQNEIPGTECLKDTLERFLPCWQDIIMTAVRSGRRVLSMAHGNSLRALVQYLDGVSDADIVEMNIPAGIPLGYELDEDMKPVCHYYRGDAERVRTAMQASADHGSLKNLTEAR